jgi:hypothetical protein
MAVGCYPFEGERLQESMVRLLHALTDLAGALDAETKDRWLVRLRALQTMVAGGLDACAATLALVEGIGVKSARRLAEAGIGDVEDLALAEVEDVIAALGGKATRARRWIERAEELVKSHGAYFFREAAMNLPAESTAPSVSPTSTVDPYRLRRAAGLRVATETSHRWIVSGGSEARRVSRRAGQFSCDCPDHQKGNVCKHLLAVRIHLRERGLKVELERLRSTSTDWSPFPLWMDRERVEVA